jgi:hypothetical protein
MFIEKTKWLKWSWKVWNQVWNLSLLCALINALYQELANWLMGKIQPITCFCSAQGPRMVLTSVDGCNISLKE